MGQRDCGRDGRLQVTLELSKQSFSLALSNVTGCNERLYAVIGDFAPGA